LSRYWFSSCRIRGRPARYEGTDAYKAHDYDLAISKFTESIKLDPKNNSAFNNRGLTYRDKNDYDAAIADFNSALGIKADWFVYYNRGIKTVSPEIWKEPVEELVLFDLRLE
jgi:tetratricopeptide (TPR) repeat protein